MLPLKPTMILIQIQGMQDGRAPFDITVPASDIPDFPAEFPSEIRVVGTVTRTGRRFRVDCDVSTTARLICDRSLEEYDEPMRVDLSLVYVIDNEAAVRREPDVVDDDGPIPLREDAKVIDVSDEVRQELVVHLPMRRVSPQYRDKDIAEIFGDLDKAENHDVENDDTWAALRGIQQRDN